jgi:hypothetical protein
MTAFFQKLINRFNSLFEQADNGTASSGTKPPQRNLGQTNPSESRTKQSRRSQNRKGHMPTSSAGTGNTDLVGFHDRGFVVAKPAEPHAHWLQERVASLPGRVSGVSTNITDGLRKAMGLLERSPRGRLRRIWLLTDGMPNREEYSLMPVVAEARKHHININTIGFGDPETFLYDPKLLRNVAGSTHNGRFVSVHSLRTLSNALKRGPRRGLGHRRPETTILVIDCSGSMVQSMEGKRRIDVVVEAITHLLH